MKIAVIGCGAIGGLLAAKLIQNKQNVFLIDKNIQHVNSINQNGIQISGVRGAWSVKARAHVDLTEEVDMALISVKSVFTAKAIEEIKPFLKSNALVVSLQNGLGNVDLIAQVVGWKNTVAGVVGWGATNLGSGQLAYTSRSGSLEIGYLNGAEIDARLEGVRKILNDCEPTYLSTNIQGHMWTKCIINAAINSLGAVYQKKLGEMISDPKIRDVFIVMLREGINVAEAKNVKLEKLNGIDFHLLSIDSKTSWLKRKIAYLLFGLIGKKHGAIKSSMWQDLERGSKTENDFLCGAIAREALALGVPTPETQRIYDSIKTLEQGISV